MDSAAYLAARLPVSGRPVLGRPLPVVLFGHVELLARVRSPFAGAMTGAAYREPQAGDLFLALEILHHPPPHLPSARRLFWLRLRHRSLAENARLDACNALADHLNAALGLPRHWTRVPSARSSSDAPSDSGCPWLLSLANCQTRHLHVREDVLPHKPMQLVIQQCFAVWAEEGRLSFITPMDDALRQASRRTQADLAAGPTPEQQSIFARLAAKNAGRGIR